MKKVFKYIIIAALALILAASLAAHAVAKKAIAWAVKKETGLEIEIGGLRMGRLSPWFEITDFRLMNPEGFADEACIHIARLYVKYSPGSLFSDTVRISRLSLDIPRVLLIEDSGKSNLDPLVEKRLSAPLPAAAVPDSRAAQSPGDAQPPPALPEFKSGHKGVSIGAFELKLGTLELRRRAAGEKDPVIQEFVFDEAYVFTNVTSPDQILQRLAASFLVKQLSGDILEP